MTLALPGHYDWGLVALSVAIAILASGAALDLAGRVASTRGGSRSAWLAGGACAMGLGIWSMHYIGMLAFHLPIPVRYDLPTVLESLLAAVLASAVALLVLSRRAMGGTWLFIGSAVMGAGIAIMHYTGMAAMRMPATITYDPVLVTLSVVIAVVVSLVALMLAFHLRTVTSLAWDRRKLGSALLMGVAIPAMHYTGMAAAHFTGASGTVVPANALSISSLGVVAVASSSFLVLALAIGTSMVDRHLATQAGTLARFAALVEGSHDGVIGATLDGTITAWNPGAELLWGYRADEVVGRSVALLAPPARAGESAALTARIANGEGLSDYETVRLRKDGTPVDVSITYSPIRDRVGQVTGISAIARNITERRQTDAALRQARDLAQQTAQAQSDFLANMSHEIRTPMNAVLGFVEIVLDTELTPEQRGALEIVRSSSEGLLTIINDILDYSKIEAEHLKLESIPFDLPKLVHGTASMLAVQAREKHLELTVDVPPDVPHSVRGDPTRVRQVLTNLIGNAVKFTEHGEVAVSVRAAARDEGPTQVEFRVRDSGIGIPPGALASIFDEFTQADASMTRRYGGTGLGLAISRRLVELMGGELTVTSEVGRGSEFSFALPLAIEAHTPQTSASGPALSLGGRRLLVVDDNETNRRLLREILGGAGAAVEEATGAAAGLEALRVAARAGPRYDLAILDGQMPDQDGFELAAAIRADADLAAMRLVMLTSAGQRGDGERCRQLRIQAYLIKPISRTDLLEAVGVVLSGSPSPAQSPDVVTRHTIAESRRTLRILLAEDNAVNQQVATAMLLKRGHQVDVVSNGREAVHAVGAHAYDIVLMDIQMPEMDGFAATEAIRALPQGRTLPIIALTAHALTGERERCLARGMSGYLAKPFKAHDLFTVVEGWVAAKAPLGAAKTP